VTAIRRTAIALCLVLVAGAAAGCGFIAAGQKSISKPTTFVLLGHADVLLPASDHAAVGATCEAPGSITGVAENTPVKVLDAHGVAIANGLLGSGIVARSGNTATCAFPFQIPAVPGGSTTYQVVIGDRPAETFPASLLRQNAPAVITITK